MDHRNLLEERGKAALIRSPGFHFTARRFLALAAATLLLAGLIAPARSQTQAAAEQPGLLLRASDVSALAKRADQLFDAVPDGSQFNTGDVVAFEENRFFAYILGDASGAHRAVEAGRKAEEARWLLRRFIFLKPSTFVVDDRVRLPAAKAPLRWLLQSPGAPEVTGRKLRIAEADNELLCETLLPKKATLKIARRAGGKKPGTDYLVEVVPEGNPAEVRFIHVLHARGAGDQRSVARWELAQEGGEVRLTVTTQQRVFRLTLPPASVLGGEIAVSKTDGESLLERRLLPSGIMPHGPQGVRLLERWDAAYHRGRRPGWDTGRPATELKKAVEDGTIRPGRAVVLGCGTGTNAIYLAGKGFDVTGIDIAPTALSRAGEKARKAGAKVRWLVADVLAPPKLEPLDFIFDRGCYHGVRRLGAAGYVEAVGRLSRPGTRILILAGNANESRHYGPPRVKEEELRGDFSSLFEFEWLRQTRFDTTDPARKGALAWSVLLRRKKAP